jgi:hypothetical protein
MWSSGGEREDLCPFGIGGGEDRGDRGGPDPRGRQGHKAFLRTSTGRKELQPSEHKR